MRQMAKLLVPAVLGVLLLAACGSSSGSMSAADAPASSPASSRVSLSLVKTASNPMLGGTVLVNAQGLTLYHLSGEQNGKWICTTAACVGVWHPVTAKSAAALKGSVASLGTVKRPNGTTQVAYKGMPLYTFVKDVKPGQANGQGIMDVGTWTAVTTRAPAGSSPPAPAAPPASGGGHSHAY